MAPKHSPPSPATAAHALLAKAGLRVTAARLQVLQTLAEAHGAMSHADIESALPEPLDRVTLYRTLDRLAESALLHKSVGEDRITRFATAQHQAEHADHAHFHCDDCGRVYCLPMKLPKKPSLPAGFALEGAELNLHGHCADCADTHHKASDDWLNHG